MLFGTSTILFALVGLAGQALAAPANLTARAEKHNVKVNTAFLLPTLDPAVSSSNL